MKRAGCGVALASAMAGMLCPPASSASDYQSIGQEPAIFYDAPTLRGRKLFVAPRGMPVEVVVPQGEWARVRDATGELAWVERKMLTETRNLVTVTEAHVRAAPYDSATTLFKVAKGVLLEMSEQPVSGWVRVKHRDGLSGFVRVAEVWGE